MTRDQEIKNLVVSVCRKFPTFGVGATSVEGNPIAHALKDRPAMFAMGVDVEDVIRLVLDQGRFIPNKVNGNESS